MELEEFYKQVGGNFEDVKRRLLNEEFIRKFVLKFKDDETFDNLIDAFNKVDYKEAFRFIHTLKGISVNLGFDDLYQASCNLTECLREKENLNDEIWRSFGILRYAQVLTADEALALASKVQVGIDLGIIDIAPKNFFNELMVISRPNYLYKIIGEECFKINDINLYRAQVIREKLKKC